MQIAITSTFQYYKSTNASIIIDIYVPKCYYLLVTYIPNRDCSQFQIQNKKKCNSSQLMNFTLVSYRAHACIVETLNKIVKYECLIIFYRAKQIVYAVPSFKAKWTSINNKSLPEPYADPFYKDEREKRSVFDFHPRENSRMLQNQLNYSPFTSYNYYDISQHSTHFHLVLLREVFWQKKNKPY